METLENKPDLKFGWGGSHVFVDLQAREKRKKIAVDEGGEKPEHKNVLGSELVQWSGGSRIGELEEDEELTLVLPVMLD